MHEEREHVGLRVVGAPAGAKQPVEVESLGGGQYRIVRTPGLVQGIAAGDVIGLTDPELGVFDVLSRGRNVAVKVVSSRPLGSTVIRVNAFLSNVGGRLDGAIEKAAVWTVPAPVWFHRIELAMEGALAGTSEIEWWYTNVYDDAGEALRWWEQGEFEKPEDVVRARWVTLKAEVAMHYPDLVQLIGVMTSFPKIASLFPVAGVGGLYLSRCTLFPYYVDFLVSSREPEYVAQVSLGGGGWVHTKQVGSGSASEVVRLIESLIPPDYGPAQVGDADLLFPRGAATLVRWATEGKP
jgi:hypothetical protein